MPKLSSKIYQFKITLKSITPRIWRRIQIVGNSSFVDLHYAIQDAMGWYDVHLHQFEMQTYPVFGMIIGTEECDMLESKAVISKYFQFPRDKAIYEYDFGDGWGHEIVLEKILPKIAGEQYPKCIAGKRACPPEDCGGPWGYQNILSIIKNPNHEEHRSMKKWLGKFNPEIFDPKLVDFRFKNFSTKK